MRHFFDTNVLVHAQDRREPKKREIARALIGEAIGADAFVLISMGDALVVQAALDARCDFLLSEDLQHGRRFGDLEIRNPFLASGGHERGTKPYRARHMRK